MQEFINVLTQYIPELASTSLGAVAIGAVVYCIKYITKRIETFRTDPAVKQLKEETKQLNDMSKRLIEENIELKQSLQDLSDSIHHIYRGK